MERLRVGLTIVVLLLGGLGQGRADYLYPSQLAELGGAAHSWYAPENVALQPFRTVLIAEALHHHIQVFLSTGTFVTRFGNLSSGYEQIFGPGEIATVSLLDPLTWQWSMQGTAFMDPSSFGVLGRQGNHAFGGDAVPLADLFAADPLNGRSGGSPGNDPFLASIGISIGEAPPAAPARLVVEPRPSILSNPKVAFSLIVVAIGALATTGFVWRRRKPASYRAPAGRRPISPYRSVSVPNPHGTISSPPP